ncbi:UDP-glycosyltransferase 83A1, partial [Linum perenne]
LLLDFLPASLSIFFFNFFDSAGQWETVVKRRGSSRCLAALSDHSIRSTVGRGISIFLYPIYSTASFHPLAVEFWLPGSFSSSRARGSVKTSSSKSTGMSPELPLLLSLAILLIIYNLSLSIRIQKDGRARGWNSVKTSSSKNTASNLLSLLRVTHHGITVTVANLDFIHHKMIIPEAEEKKTEHGGIKLVSLGGGFGPDFDSNDPFAFTESVEKVLPNQLRELLLQIQLQQEEQFSCVIADAFLFGAFIVAKEFGIKTAALWTSSMENLALMLRIPQLIDSCTIDENGSLLNKELPISICEEILAWKTNELPWSCPSDQLQNLLFHHYCVRPSQYLSLFDRVHWSQIPLTVISQEAFGVSRLAWLDEQPPNSVIYVAFGSIALFNQQQFEELAFGLEMTGRPFLLVIRINFVKGWGVEFLDEVLERVVNRGKIVEWTNQEEVLSHPSTGCFVSHCGWNSTLDGLWCGVPFLCWPYFGDQFHNRESICESWKVGLKFDAEDETGLITRSEIVSKIERLFNDGDDDTIRGNAIRLREAAMKSVNEGGSSYFNFSSFINEL